MRVPGTQVKDLGSIPAPLLQDPFHPPLPGKIQGFGTPYTPILNTARNNQY